MLIITIDVISITVWHSHEGEELESAFASLLLGELAKLGA